MSITLTLTKGQVAVIDDADAHLARFKWTAEWAPAIQGYYAYRRDWKAQKKIYLHRAVLESAGFDLAGLQGDHINHDTLDNTRANLRPVTRAQSLANRRKQRKNTSGFKGVFLVPGGKFLSKIGVDYRDVRLGLFSTAEEAAAAYDRAARELHGEFACTNFPEAA